MSQNSGLMQGKRGVILGVANNRSIAWGIAKACHAAGAEIALTWQGDALKKRVEPLAKELGGILLGHCDVTDPATIDAVFDVLRQKWGKIDFVVHAIAFSDKDQLDGRYLETTADNFSKTMLISCYSLTAIAQRAEKLLTDGGSILTLTYYGAEKWMPHYNVMGVAKAALEASVRYLAADLGEKNIRVNAISAGPIKTLAASGIGDFRYILKWNEYNAPMRRTVTIEEVGDSALYLLSDLSRGVTGEVHHVDSGYHVVGMKRPGRAGYFAQQFAEQGIAASLDARADHLLHSPWRDRLERARTLPGIAGYSAQRSRPHARPSPPATFSPTCWRAMAARPSSLAVRRKPARPRAADHGAGARHDESAAGRIRVDDRLREIGYGQWEGLTLPEMKLHDAATFASRDARQMGRRGALGRELCQRHAADARLVRFPCWPTPSRRPWRHHAGADGRARHRDAAGGRRHADRAGRGLRVQRRRAEEV